MSFDTPFDWGEHDAEAGIEIPFPHRTLYPGSAADPFGVRLHADEPTPKGPADPALTSPVERPVADSLSNPADPVLD